MPVSAKGNKNPGIITFASAINLGLLFMPLSAVAAEAFEQQQRKVSVLAALVANHIPDILQVSSEDDIALGYIHRESPFRKTTVAPSGSTSEKQEKTVKTISIDTQAKLKSVNLRNRKLSRDEKRVNEQELEPVLRVNAWVMKNNPLYGQMEIEWKQKTRRRSGEQRERNTKLELNQFYLGVTEDIINYSQLRLGRWLYRDEREWLFDENIDGINLQTTLNQWSVDALAGRVNYWQKDLLDHSSRNRDPVNIGSVIVRREMGDKWSLGAYGMTQYNSDNSDRQFNVGLRSHHPAKTALRHWFELGMSTERRSTSRRHGYAADLGGTYQFDYYQLNPRVTLGYAFASRDYQQTGLNANEATFGGNTKFKIYGETFAPELTNLHVITSGVGINITPKATLDLVYHGYTQARLADLDSHKASLKTKYDRQNTRYLGSGADVVFGWKPTDNTKIEALLGMFAPSKRFVSGDKPNSSHAANAYFLELKAEIRF